MNEAKSKAYMDELGKEPTDEEKNPYIKVGQLEIKNDTMKELKGVLTDKRTALFQKAKAESEIAFRNSKEVHQLDDQIIQIKANTVTYQKQTKQRNIYTNHLNKCKKARSFLR